MSEISISLEYARRKKSIRLKQNKFHRRKFRSKFFSPDSLDVEQSTANSISLINLTLSNEDNLLEPEDIPCVFSSNNNNKENNLSENVDSLSSGYEYLEFNDICGYEQIPDLSLHPYTTRGFFSFTKDLISFIRQANISKSHTGRLIDLIQSSLPQPNTLPKTYSEMLNILSVENLFMKRVACISCKKDLLLTSKACTQCTDNNTQRLAIIFDSIQETIFTRIYDDLYFEINSYRECFTKQAVNNETNDIVYNRNYKIFLDSIQYPFISIILHLDGISLSKSKIQHLWILSCSLVELPPNIRSRRRNNIILSLWIAKEQPEINLWLDRCFAQLTNLKIHGFPSRSNERIILKVYGIIGDTLALNLILNHNSHVGYSCCWYCKLVGVHINHKRQYYYDKNVALRNQYDFAADSRSAQHSNTKINGRRGISILEKIVDIPLPRSIITDYLHVTLLGHAKTTILYLYKYYMKPIQRAQFDKKIYAQPFPHFFTRKIRAIQETHLKATEIRNLFLFCILPMIKNILHYNVVAHLALFVVGIRLLHGRPAFGNQTADIAHTLLVKFYYDHERFYSGLQNFVLHIHCHFAELYRNHGSLYTINTFSQEELMGVVAKCKHGTNRWADQLAFYLNIDFALKYGKKHEQSIPPTQVFKGVFDKTDIPDEIVQISINIHSSICNCQDMINCMKFYRRFRNDKEIVYHSLSYKRRKLSVSYFVKYGNFFGSIVVFMWCNGKEYAIVNRYTVKNHFSDYFISSYYYDILSKPIDSFFFVLDKVSDQLDVINIQTSMEMCIVIEEDDCFIVSPLSVYHEHD